MKKAEVKPEIESSDASETLEQITKEWIEKQKSKIKNTTTASNTKRVSDFKVLKLLNNTMNKKRQFGDIRSWFGLYTPNIIKLLKNMWNDFLRSTEFMLRIERYENKAEKKS
jgi:hypothetical protein